MTQEQLAMLLGVSRQAISKWESEKAYPEMDKLLMLCDIAGCRSVRFCRIGHSWRAMGRLEPVNTNQKSPSDSGANHPTGNSCNPLLGHAISHAATLIGLFAIVLWGFMAGLVRLVSESFGATLGSALIYTVGGMLLLIVRRPKPIREAPRKYLIAGGLMFIAYEASISLSIGLATTNAQSVEVSLVNYLWPTLLVLMTAAVSRTNVVRSPKRFLAR